MRLNKSAQAALLLCIYLRVNTRGNLLTISEETGVSMNFLEQIGRKLRVAGVLTSIRGPGGGYVLATDATVGDILAAIKEKGLINPEDYRALSTSPIEVDRILGGFALSATVQIAKLQKLTISQLVDQQTVTETRRMDNADLLSTVTQ